MSPNGDEIAPAIRISADQHVDEVKKADSKHNDVGLTLFEESLGMDPELRDQLAKRVLRKLDLGLLPVVRFQTLHTIWYIFLTIPDVFHLPHVFPGQADLELCQRIQLQGRLTPCRYGLLLGRLHCQLWYSGWLLPGVISAPKVPYW